jgi:hypothetical protein
MSHFLVIHGHNHFFFQRWLNEQPLETQRQITRAERDYSRIRKLTDGPAQRDYEESFIGYAEGSMANS